MSRKLKAVNAVEGKSPFGGVSFTPKCPSCGRLSQNSMTPFGSPSSIPILCRNCGKRYEVSFSYEEDTSNSIRLEKVTYHNKMFFRDIDSLSLPVPDGYHYGEDGSEENAGWAYIVPEDVSLSDNHYDARPFSFGVTVRPAGRWPFEFEADKIAAFRNVFLSHGYLSSDVGVDDLVVSDHCAFLYQTWINDDDKTYIKVNGLLFAGNDIYQFHIMANHSEEIGGDEDFVDAFLELCRDWMRRVRFDEDAADDELED